MLHNTQRVTVCSTGEFILAHDVFLRTNRRAITMMFVRLSVCLSWTGVHCDHTVHVSADLNLCLDSPMFWHPYTKACPLTPSRRFPVPPGREMVYRCAN